MKVRAILTDIEGTTSSIHFVHEVLFPYAKSELRDFLTAHAADPEVCPWLQRIATELAVETSNLKMITSTLLEWIEADRKHTALKALQGIIWREGYQSGAFRAHLYPEVASKLKEWSKQHLLYVYSSGSIAAQKLFFGYSEAGDLRSLFQGFFDTTSGAKRERDSYVAIARSIGLIPGDVLFLSDIEAELDAARACGMQTTLLAREERPTASNHPIAKNFDEVSL
jgi:enolase-phosphatase E1